MVAALISPAMERELARLVPERVARHACFLAGVVPTPSQVAEMLRYFHAEPDAYAELRLEFARGFADARAAACN